jgi:hypothetical protein
MYSRDHAILSLVVATVGVSTLDLSISWPVTAVVALVAGVGIDVDHFLIARLTTGEWRALRRCLSNPRLVFFDQDGIFRHGSIRPLQRLLSHVVIIAVVVPALALVDVALAVFVAAVLYVHLFADLVWDNYREYHEHTRERAVGSND